MQASKIQKSHNKGENMKRVPPWIWKDIFNQFDERIALSRQTGIVESNLKIKEMQNINIKCKRKKKAWKKK